MQLRPYQQAIVDECRQHFREKRRSVLVQLATGGGKTALASSMVSGMVRKNNICWWLTHRRELVAQSSSTFAAHGIPHGVVTAGHVSDPSAPAQIASIQTIVRRLDRLPPPDVLVFDESHHLGAGQWQQLFEHFPRAKVLGLTATPWRLDGVGLGRWFEVMVQGPTVAELIEQGFLSRYRLFAPEREVDLSGVGISGGDYKRDQLAELMDKPTITGDAVEHYKRLCPGSRAVVFACSIEHSERVARSFNAAGVPAEHVDGSTPTELRDAALDRFRRGETLVLSNCELFGEGFDLPAIEAVILLRPTKSLSLHLQQIGRGLRTIEGKSEAVVLDHAGNSLVHGLPDDDRDWSLADRQKRKRGESSAAEVQIKKCPQCRRIHRPAPVCPGCGHVYETQGREIEHVAGSLSEVDREAIRLRKKEELKRARTLEELVALGQARAYRNPHFWAKRILEGREQWRAQRFSGGRHAS
jgi:DNA repair protein RadD